MQDNAPNMSLFPRFDTRIQNLMLWKWNWHQNLNDPIILLVVHIALREIDLEKISLSFKYLLIQ